MPTTRLLMAAVLLLFVLVPGSESALSTGKAVQAASLAQYDFVHDPSMIRQGPLYYLFSTGAPQGEVGEGNAQIRTSQDLRHWDYTGTVFAHIPAWITSAIGQIPNLWAPDISLYRGQYQLYYAGSAFGTNNSVIGLATNATLDRASPAYRWVDRGLAVRSTTQDDWNAIDPSFVLDAGGHPWLAFGSFWGGVKLAALDPATRKPTSPHPVLYSLAYRPRSNAVEAPFIAYRAPYYYLFVSFDRCCNGVDSTYRIMVGRARAITGPYSDHAGTPMSEGGGTQLLASAGYVRGPGGQSVLRDGGRYLLVFHYYDARDAGQPKVRIAPLAWSNEGWPSVGTALDP